MFLVFALSLLAGEKKSAILLFPGLPQLKQGKIVKGIFLAGSFTAFLAGALVENQVGYHYYDLYREATSKEDAVYYREKTQGSFRRRNYFILAAALVWTVHIIDLKISSRRKIKIRGKVEKNSASLGLGYSF